MHVNSFPLGPLGTNSYILDNGIEALAIDVGGDPADMLAFLSRNNLKLLAILITHRHFDHLYGVAALQKVLDVPCYLPSGEDVLRDSEASVKRAFRKEARA